MALWKVQVDGRARWAVGRPDEGPVSLLASDMSLDSTLATGGRGLESLEEFATDGPVPESAKILAPVQTQEVWAAGVTYERSREARQDESGDRIHYQHVYSADRPELFLKATPTRARGTGHEIAIRDDSEWNVPEPELGLVIDAGGTIVAYVIGNDVSSRSIEAANPLYLPQAKVYSGSCAVGPCLVPVAEAPAADAMEIRLRIVRDGASVMDESVPTALLRRTPEELAEWLMYAQDFPSGVVLLTGTGLVPEDTFTLHSGDLVSVAITGLGELTNTVTVVGSTSTVADQQRIEEAG